MYSLICLMLGWFKKKTPPQSEKIEMDILEELEWRERGSLIGNKIHTILTHHPSSDKASRTYEDEKVLITSGGGSGEYWNSTVLYVKNGPDKNLVFRHNSFSTRQLNDGCWIEYVDTLHAIAKENQLRQTKLLWEPIDDCHIFKRPA